MGLEFLIAVLLITGFCMAVVLLIAAYLSEDKENGIIKQLWYTFFGGDEDKRG